MMAGARYTCYLSSLDGIDLTTNIRHWQESPET